MRKPDSSLDEFAFKARTFELSLYPVAIKAGKGKRRLGGMVGRVPKPAPYDPGSRDGDNDGLVQEGTIWERPSGAIFRGVAAGARALAGATLVDRDGNKLDYKPGDHENSPLRRRGGGPGERLLRGRGEFRRRRAQRRRDRADREESRAGRQREAIAEAKAKEEKLGNAVAADSKERMLEAERNGDNRAKMSSFLEGFVEGFTGVEQNWKINNRGERTEEQRNILQGGVRMEGERRRIGDEAGNEPLTQREIDFDDLVLPEGVDREEHRRKLEEDPAYRAAWNRRLENAEVDLEKEGEFFVDAPPLDADGNVIPDEDLDVPEVDVPEVDADEVRDVQEPDPDLPDLGMADRDPPWPARRYDEMEDREVEQRINRIIAADPEGFRGFRLDERDALIEERRRRRDAGDWDGDQIVVGAGETPESQGGGAPDPDADIPEDDGPNARLRRRFDDQAEAIEAAVLDAGDNENELAEVEFNLDELDREATEAFNAGALEQADLDGYAERMRPVRRLIEVNREERQERDRRVNADLDAAEEAGRVVDADVQVPGEDIDVPEVGRPEEGWALYADLTDEQLEERLNDVDPPDLDFLLREERRRGDLRRNDNELAELRNDLQARGWVNRDREVAEEQERRALLDEMLPDLPEDAPDPDVPANNLPAVDNDPDIDPRQGGGFDLDNLEAADRNFLNDIALRREDEWVERNFPGRYNEVRRAAREEHERRRGIRADEFQENIARNEVRNLDDADLGRIVRGELDEGEEINNISPERLAQPFFARAAREEIQRRNEERPIGNTLVDLEQLSDEEMDNRILRIVAQDPVGNDEGLRGQLQGLFRERDRRLREVNNNERDATPEGILLASDRERVRDLDNNELADEIELNRNGDAVNDELLLNGLAEQNERALQLGEDPPDLGIPEDAAPEPRDVDEQWRERFDGLDAGEVGDEGRRQEAQNLVNALIQDRRDNPVRDRDVADWERADNALREAVLIQADEDNILRIKNLREGDGRIIRDLESRNVEAEYLLQEALKGRLTPEMLDEAIEVLRRWEGVDAPAGNRGRLTRSLRRHRRELIQFRDLPEAENLDMDFIRNMDRDEFNELVSRRIQGMDALRSDIRRDIGDKADNLERLRKNNAELPLLFEEAQRRSPVARQIGQQRDLVVAGRSALKVLNAENDAPVEGIPGETLDALNDIPQRDFRNEDNPDAIRAIGDLIENVRKKIARPGGRAGRNNDAGRGGVPALDGHKANVDRALDDMDRRWRAAPRGSEERAELGRVRTKLRGLQERIEGERGIRQRDEQERRERAERLDRDARAGLLQLRDWNNGLDMDDFRNRRDNDPDDEALLNDIELALNAQANFDRDPNVANIIGDDPFTNPQGVKDEARENRRELRRIRDSVQNRAAIRENREFLDGKRARIDELGQILDNNPEGNTAIDREVRELYEQVVGLPDLPRGSVRDDRRNIKQQLQVLQDKVGERNNVRRVNEVVGENNDIPLRIGELQNKIDAGEMGETDIDADLAEIEAILDEINNLPRIRQNDELNERRRAFRQEVRELDAQVKGARRDIVLGPLGDPAPFEGDDVVPDNMANRSQRVQPRPAGLGIAGQRNANGFFEMESVPVGNQGMDSQIKADRFVRSGGDISQVPDEYLAGALLENASQADGERFKITVVDGGAIGTTRVMVQRRPDGTYGKHGFVIKAHEPGDRDVDGLNELVGAEVAHRLGLPILPGRGNGKMRTRNRNQGTVVVLEHGMNVVEGGDDMRMEPRFIPRELNDQEKGLSPRLDNFMVNWLLGVGDRHPGNGILAQNGDGDVAAIPIDLAWNFRDTSRDPRQYHFRMDSGLLSDLKLAASRSPETRERLEEQIRTMLTRFNEMIGDDGVKNQIFRGGAFEGIFVPNDVASQMRKLERHLDVLAPNGQIDVDEVIGRFLGNAAPAIVRSDVG